MASSLLAPCTPVPHCPHRPPCPGCPRLGASDLAPGALDKLSRLAGLAGVPLATHSGARSHFRRRARLSVRGRSASAKVGVFEAGSHRLADIPRCAVHHPTINLVAQRLKAAIAQQRVPTYSDRARAGILRGIQVAVERERNTAQVVVIANCPNADPLIPLLQQLEDSLGNHLHSLWFNSNQSAGNVVLGDTWQSISGPPMLRETIGGVSVFFPPGAFGQNNLDLFDQLVSAVHESIPNDCELLELYCGTGSLGLGVLHRVASAVFNELGAHSLKGLEQGLCERPPEEQRRAQVLPGTAERALETLRPGQVVLVDPPRKGLDPGGLAALTARAPRRLIYVSCGLDSFLRDAQALRAGGLNLVKLSAFDLFPYTEHVETLGVFEPATASHTPTY